MLTDYLIIDELFLAQYWLILTCLDGFAKSLGKSRTFVRVIPANTDWLCDLVFVFRLSLCQMSWWEPSLGTEPPLAPSSRWSPGGGSSTNPSLWQSQCPLDRPKVILAANGATVHHVCVCSAASQVRTWLWHSNTASADPPTVFIYSLALI